MTLMMLMTSFSVSRAASQPAEPSARENTAMARALFHEGLSCVDAGDHACAADRFARSNELRPSPIALYNQAQAEIPLGRLVAASEALRSVDVEGAPAEVRDAARAMLQSVLPRVARLRVAAHPGDVVSIDRITLPVQAIGVFVPVDPGARSVRVQRGDAIVVETSVDLGEGERRTLEVSPPTALTAAGVEDSSLEGERDPLIASPTAPAPSDTRPDRTARRWGIGLSTAVVVVVTAVAIGLAARRGETIGDTNPIEVTDPMRAIEPMMEGI